MSLPGDIVAEAIRESGLSIYDLVDIHSDLFFDIGVLEDRLDLGLKGMVLDGPLRTRGKKAKEAVAALMGYPVPLSFKRTKPRFPGQNLDVFVQKSNNLQLWNEEAEATRRYGLIRVDDSNLVTRVRVLTGSAVAEYDTTGTLTSKYQAKRKAGLSGSMLVTEQDTSRLREELLPSSGLTADQLRSISPIARPVVGSVLPIASIFDRLVTLVGQRIHDPGQLQDRNRGAELHKRICSVLGLGAYADAGQFPDVRSQALEIKLQMSPTIDLGLVAPSGTEPAEDLGEDLRHCDVRYAIIYGEQLGTSEVLVTEVVVSTGEGFFDEFRLFGGLIQNRKLQLRLPDSLFDAERPPD
jgi:hypothetical protein